MTEQIIRSGQTYRSADPRELIRIRIKTYTPGEKRALVVDAATGKRPRPLLVTALHSSPTTQAGKRRRAGYILEQPGTAATQPDPTTADDPTPLRWGLGDVLHGDDDTVIVCLSGPDREPYWLELEPERAVALREDIATSVVEQPAEAPDGEPRRPETLWHVVARQNERWMFWSPAYPTRERADEARSYRREDQPSIDWRIVRAHTAWTVEYETQ